MCNNCNCGCRGLLNFFLGCQTCNRSGNNCGCLSNRSGWNWNNGCSNNNNCGCYDEYYAMQYGLNNCGCGHSDWFNRNTDRSGWGNGCSSNNWGCGCRRNNWGSDYSSNNSGCGCQRDNNWGCGCRRRWWSCCNSCWNN